MQFNYFHLKIIAILAMTLGHVAWVWVDTSSFLGQLMHFLGRLTAPIMCFLLVEGFFKTKNYQAYVGRLLLFACLAQFPFIAILQGLEFFIDKPEMLFSKGNVLFNFLLALLALGVIYKTNLHYLVKFFILVLLLFFSTGLDWGIFLICFALVFAKFRENRNQQMIVYIIVAMGLLLLVDLGIVQSLPTLILQWMPIGILLVPLVLYFCNYQSGSRWGGRYFFYTYYPLHMFFLALIAYVLG